MYVFPLVTVLSLGYKRNHKLIVVASTCTKHTWTVALWRIYLQKGTVRTVSVAAKLYYDIENEMLGTFNNR